MNTQKRNRVSKILAITCIATLLISSFAYFTDRETKTATAKVGNLDLVFTDISASKTGAASVKSENAFALDKAWTNGIVEDGKIINPGDTFDLSYKMSNTGNKSMDVAQLLTVTSTKPMTSTQEFKLQITGKDYNTTTVTGQMSDDNKSIVYKLDDIVLNGTGENGEKEDGVDWTEQTYTVKLVFDLAAKNAFQDADVTVKLDAQAKQHRNTDDVEWESWSTYVSSGKVEQVS